VTQQDTQSPIRNPRSPIRAAIFDIGGVLTTSPVVSIRRYVESQGHDYSVIGPMIAHHDLAWSRWERSELSEDEFVVRFEAECLEAGFSVSARGILEAAFGSQATRPEMVSAVRHLRGRLRLAAITNNVARGDSTRPGMFDLLDLFEEVLESSKLGIRKPDPRIYQLACERLGVAPHEAVFLDDIGANLKGARALGMVTIRVDETLGALEELEAVVGFPLPRPA
jgi:putative hydrolase of the HAD superfamily